MRNRRLFLPVKSTCVLGMIVALTMTADLPALGQETGGQRLERVEVNPPTRRNAPAPPRTGRGSDSDESAQPDQPFDQPSDQPTDYQGRGVGSGPGGQSLIPSSTLSVVTGKSSVSSVGATSLPSQVTVVPRQEVERLDVRNYTDLFRTVPGIKAIWYGQGDIGNPLQIRGFSSNHGADTLVYVDGVPMVFPSDSHQNGLVDISWLTPEMVDRIEVIKGPFSALYGNMAQAGVINIITKKSDPAPSLTVSGGSFGTFRAVPILTSEAWVPTPFVLNEYLTMDGYRDNSQYKHWSSFNKVTVPLYGGNLSLRFNYYKSDWGAPGYLFLDDVQAKRVHRTHANNSSDGGDEKTGSLVANYSPCGTDAGLYFTAYIDNYQRNRFAQTLPTSVQAWNHNERTFYGGRVFYNLVFGNCASMIVGAEGRYDNGFGQTFNTVLRQPTETTADYGFGLWNPALFVQGQVKLADSVKLVGGVRKDFFGDAVDNRLTPANSGKGNLSTLSPKAGFVITPFKNMNVNIFGNMAMGFHAPAANELSPATGPRNFDLQVAQTDAADLGLNATLFDRLYVAVDWYRTDMQNEVQLVVNQEVNIGNTRRNGVEVEARFYANEQINLFVNWAYVDAKVKNPTTAGQDLVTGVSPNAIKAGLEFSYCLAPNVKFLGDIYCEYASEQPFYLDATPVARYSPDYVLYNLKTSWQGRNWGLFTAVKYQPKELGSEFVSASGDHFFFNPDPLWDVSGGVKYTF